MSSNQQGSHDLEIANLQPHISQQAHRYDTVNISGGATAILGDVHHYHTSQTRDIDHGTGHLKVLLDQLAYPEINSRYQTLNEPYPNTFTWVLSPSDDSDCDNGDQSDLSFFDQSAARWDSFPDWLKDGTTPYWISGKLGTGKSTLMKFIVERLSCSYNGYGTTTNAIVISHFFWEPGSRLQNSVIGCLRTLTWQLLHFTESMRSGTLTVNPFNLGSTRRLREDLMKVIRSFDKTVIVLLDGLDECRETDDLLDLVEALASLTHVKLCVSSRREEVYILQFSDFPKLRLQDLNREDIERYVKKELLENSRVRRSPSWTLEAAQDLANSVMLGAEGVFLWVRLVVKDLLRGWTNRDDLSRMQKRLQKLPQNIYELYTQLIRRDQEDMAEYASEAAVYYQLLAQSWHREMSLLSLFFAINENIRERYLDTETVFESTLAELERDADLETLITWINTRTAGLLEVEVGRNVFRYCTQNRPGPCGKHAQFQTHWVGFIHRSAYTYLRDTSEGQLLVKNCPIAPDTITNIYFESQLAALLIVPGTYNFRFEYMPDLGDLFSPKAATSIIFPEWCRLLQRVCDSLFARGLLLDVLQEWFWAEQKDQHSMSICRIFNLCMLFTARNFDEAAEVYLQEYKYQDNHSCMVGLLLLKLLHLTRARVGDIAPVLQELVTHVKEFDAIGITQSGEEVSVSVHLAALAAQAFEAERAAPIWEFLRAYRPGSSAVIVPASRSLIDRHLFYDGIVDDLFGIAATTSIDTTKAWSQGLDFGESSAIGRALFFKNRTRTAEEYNFINPADSDEVLERLRVMVLSKSLLMYGDGRHVDLHHEFQMSAGFFLSGDRDFILSQGLQHIFDRSLRCYSLVDCLRHLGKSEETIDYIVREQVKIAAHDNFEKRDDRFFRRLLGSDPQILASWCQKNPQLTKVFGNSETE